MEETKEFERALKVINNVSRRLPNILGTVAVNFFKERFQAQNWVGDRTEPWPARKEDRRRRRRETRTNRGILTKTGRLRRSIRKISVIEDSVLIGTDVPYAQVHNEGGVINHPARQGKLSFAQKGKSANARLVLARTRTEKQRSRIVDEWKGEIPAYKVKMPRRQFIGFSQHLDDRMVRQAEAEYNRAIKSL